ncbi:prohibitin family protein [Kordia zhangzhouensis]|uniref:prohibitin family protein n=1 Tax=Kordia zhangzhouensis TaxID=1620405 RepID=UPI0006295F9F|nr:prohibitin family protein [Kordia zhangzhouensis]
MDKLPKIGIPILIVAIAVIILIAKSAVTIDAGHAAVLYKTLGNGVDSQDEALRPGFHLIAPWNRVIDYEIRLQEVPETMSVLSSNGLDIKLDASVQYMPDVNNLGKLHNEKGESYLTRVLQPAVRSAARSVVGRYTPEQLYSSKRDAIQNEIFEETKKIVEDQYIILERVLIRDVKLPSTIKEAIERKLKQEQESLEYEFRLVTAQKEAEKVRIEAQGKADANRILSASLTDKILQDKGIEATMKLSESPNSKVIVIGSGDSGLPIILGNQ